MGSFSMTCSVSGLGIGYGTQVRCLLLTQSPYGDDDPRKAWIVRTPPIRAKYNDYGSIEDVHREDKHVVELWLRGLREDAVEKGLGDNSCHDVPVSRDMTFEQMLGAIQERRLEVIQDARGFWMRPLRDVDDVEGVEWTPPLMKQVMGFLEEMQPGCVGRDAGEGKYVVDEPVPRMARVRFGRYEQGDRRAPLYAARAALVHAGLVGVVTAGSGRYANEADLLVFPAPREADSTEHVSGPQWDMRAGASANDHKTLRVGLAMIREDVWQALIQFPHNQYISDRYPHTIDYPHVLKKTEWGSYAWHGLDAFKFGVGKAWESLRRRLLREPLSDEEKALPGDASTRIDDFLEKARAAETKRRATLTDEQRAAEDEVNKERNKLWKAEELRKKEHPFFGDFHISSTHYSEHTRNLPGGWAFFDSTPGVISLGDHFSMLLADKTDVSEGLLCGVAELTAVRQVLSGVGVVLCPAESTGPQSPEWGELARFARMSLTVAEAQREEHDDTIPTPTLLSEVVPDEPADKANGVPSKLKRQSKKPVARKPAAKKAKKLGKKPAQRRPSSR